MWVGGNTDTFSEQRFRGRVRFASVVFASLYVLIAIRLFYLQVIKGSDLANLSESNRTQVIFLRAPRGDFFDRNNQAFVLNRPSWSLMYSVPEKSHQKQEELKAKLAPFLKDMPPLWEKRLQKAFETKQMVRLVEDVPEHVAFLMREMEDVYPGLRVVMEFRRGYPTGIVAGHLIGYLGEVSERELRDHIFGARKSGDLIGKMGLERLQDEKLRGQDGGVLIEVDSVGRLKRIIKELPFQKGNDIHLSLDLDVQRVAEEELLKTNTKRGAAVAMDVRTGAVLAWASAPTFDPLGNLAEGLKDPHSPFLDRVYKGAYPPGSVFKIITAMAGFENNMIRPSEKIDCIGYETLPDKRGQERRYKCWKRHGIVDYWRAMAESCDSYFYLMGKKLGSQSIYEIGQMFGFGQSVQTLLSGENKGTLPNPAWKKRLGLGGWSTGDTFNMSIGQGFVTSTPLQICVLMSGLATRGLLYHPFVVNTIEDSTGKIVYKADASVWKTITLKDSTWDSIHRSLESVVAWGTGQATRIEYLDVRGKTGTAQNPHGEDHAWFAGYAGYKGEAPAIAVCVFVENGGHGGAVSAPIVKRILETALPNRNASPLAEATRDK